MSKLVKNLVTTDLRGRYSGIESALWLELVGVDGITTNEFRRELHGRKMRLEVVKTSLFRRAVQDQPLAVLARQLTGPVALLTGPESAVELAKAVESWLPKIKGLKLRGALLDGQFLDHAAAEKLSKMPTKRDMQAQLARLIQSPAANLAAVILSGGSRVAGALKALAEKREKEEGAAAAA